MDTEGCWKYQAAAHAILQQQHSLFSQASWGRLEMKPERNPLMQFWINKINLWKYCGWRNSKQTILFKYLLGNWLNNPVANAVQIIVSRTKAICASSSLPWMDLQDIKTRLQGQNIKHVSAQAIMQNQQTLQDKLVQLTSYLGFENSIFLD